MNRIDEIAERLDAIEADATGVAFDAYSGAFAYRDARRLLSEVKRLEGLALDGDFRRCDGCERVFADGEYGYDCFLCKGCADEIRAGGHVECRRHPGEDRELCACAFIVGVPSDAKPEPIAGHPK